MSINAKANEVDYTAKRVPAEFEPQEAIWMQWPGYWEKDYEITFAKDSGYYFPLRKASYSISLRSNLCRCTKSNK